MQSYIQVRTVDMDLSLNTGLCEDMRSDFTFLHLPYYSPVGNTIIYRLYQWRSPSPTKDKATFLSQGLTNDTPILVFQRDNLIYK